MKCLPVSGDEVHVKQFIQENEVEMSAIEELLEALEEARDDIQDGYAGKTKVSATRARKAMMTVKDAAHEARKELLAIRDGESDPVELDFDIRLGDSEES